MKTYLLFFGSSDGFEFVAYDISSGDCDGFKSRFKNFDQLDPKFIITDELENTPVFGKYRFDFNGVSLSLLKIYQCAQSSVSSRIAGSNIGIAFISEKDLSFDRANITLLQELQKSFCQQALKGYRFKDKSFIEVADQLFEKFKGRLSEIRFDSDRLDTSNLAGNAVYVARDVNEQKIGLINNDSKGYTRFYLCSDLAHAERSLQAKMFLLFVEHKNEFLTKKDYLEAIKSPKLQPPPPEAGKESATGRPTTGGVSSSSVGSKDFEHEIRKLEERIDNANKHIKKLNGSIKTLRVTLISCVLFCFASWSYVYFFNEKEKIGTEKKIITKQIEVNPLKDILAAKDTSSTEALADFLAKYNSLIRKGKEPDALWKDSSYIELNKKLRIK